jgi:hypothetical protein
MSKTGERVGARSRDFGISVTLRGGSQMTYGKLEFFGGTFSLVAGSLVAGSLVAGSLVAGS